MDFATLFSLEGRTALVTGGSRGIGKMIVQGLLAAGCRKVYISARKEEQIAAAVEELGDKVVGIPMDISTVEGCKALAAAIGEHEEKLDILINNAGAAWGEDYLEFSEAGWDRAMDLNVKSPFFLTQALHQLLTNGTTQDHPGKVINIGSIDGMRLNPWETYSYHASKAAILWLTKRMAARLIRDNVIVTAIAPGAFASEMNKAARDAGDAVAKSIPAGRIGDTEDMAAAAIYLCSRAGNYVVGETITVDGGLVHADTRTSIDA